MPLESSANREANRSLDLASANGASAIAAESTGTKLLREVELFSSAGTGFISEAHRAMENPGETSLKVAGAAAFGLGLAVLTRKPGMLGVAAESLGIAGGVSFGLEVAQHGNAVAQAAKSSWQSDSEQRKNIDTVSSSAGAFLFDTTLMGAAGSAGAIGARSYFARQAAAKIEIPLLQVGEEAAVSSKVTVSKYDDLAKLYSSMSGKVGRVEVLAQEDGGMAGRFGTAFSVGKDGRMVTNHHVVDGSLDLTVFDRFGRAHQAEVIKSSPLYDLALIQLKNPTAASSFSPVTFEGSGVIKANVSGESLFGVGFPNGWQKPFLSPGETISAVRVDPLNMRIKLHSENGNSGGPIINADGGLVGVLKQGDRSNHDITILTPAESVVSLIESAKMAGRTEALPVVNRQYYEIGDRNAAAANVEKLFPLEKRVDGTTDFFHSRVTRVLMPTKDNRISELMLRSQYQPASRQIVVEPLAVDGKALAHDAVWPGSNVPIKSSKLIVSLDRNQVPVSMEGINDPKQLLRRAFDLKSSGSYFSSLEGQAAPTTIKQQVRSAINHVLEWLESSVHT
ncbi:hypothetical protein BH11CYA1_BH11CYA1_28670 [soil metagenome]